MTPRPRGRLLATILVPVAMLVALLAWGISSPVGSSPDDDYHMASIWCSAGEAEGICEATTDPDERMLPGDLLRAAKCYAFIEDQSASCPLPEGKMLPTDRGNWFHASYPPVFYSAMSPFVTHDVGVSIVLMRSANALLYVGIVTALFFLLPRRQRPVLLWGAAISAVPLGMFLIPSVNPSSWAVLSATGLWIAAWGYFAQTGVRKWLLAGLSALLLIIGAGSRSDAAVYGVIALLAAAALSFRRDRRYAVDLIVPAVLAVIAVVFFFNAGQSAIVTGDTAVEDGALSTGTLILINGKMLPQLWAGVFGLSGLGWLDTIMPGIVWITALTIFAALCFWGFRRGDWRKWVAVAGVAASLVVIPMYILVHDGVTVGSGVQPRYIYPLIIMLGGVALVGFARGGLGLGRVQLVIVAAGLTAANSVALHTNLRRYITGMDSQSFNLNANIEWWWNAPVSPMVVWAGGSLAFAVVLGTLVAVLWRGAATAETSRVDLQESVSS
ncbi:DUF2142 domain-containing protein [Microbacterium sp. NPDC058062]|uniref:DUF2142 domain-containing protein n=1 Tax=Microbacterium sp. NPDC058062 TaxID=3346320 RepID=UPI0036DBC58A